MQLDGCAWREQVARGYRVRHLLDEARHFLVVEAVRSNILALATDAAGEGTLCNPGKLDPGLNLDPTGRTTQRDEQAFVSRGRGPAR